MRSRDRQTRTGPPSGWLAGALFIVGVGVGLLGRRRHRPDGQPSLSSTGPGPAAPLSVVNALVEQSSDTIVLVDDAGQVQFASPAARTLFGTSRLAGRGLADFVAADERGLLRFLLDSVARGDTPYARADLTLTTVDCGQTRAEVVCRDLRAEAGIGGFVLTMRDVTEQRRLERELTRQVFRDELTGLPNQTYFHDAVRRSLSSFPRCAGVMVLDLDRFRSINESFGRTTGDAILTEIGRRLSELAEPGVAARLGGDEFALLVNGPADVRRLEQAADQVVAAVSQPVGIEGGSVSCTTSIGVAAVDGPLSETELLRRADTALDAAKLSGTGSWRRYEPSMAEAVEQRNELRAALSRALREDQLFVEYQPVVELRTGQTIGFEALVRWRHPVRGLLSPAEFIEIAEDSDLIEPLGRLVLTTALRAARGWRAHPGRGAPYVAVNVSVRQFRQPGFADLVFAQLDRAGVPPRRLVLEITESLLLRDDDAVWEELQRLRIGGIRIAIDDFGTGYSALGYLRQVPLDIIKLDQLFIRTVVTSRRQRELVRGIVALVRDLGLDTVAEGIETVRQRDICAEFGCGSGQGYLFARPMPADEVATWLAGGAPVAPAVTNVR